MKYLKNTKLHIPFLLMFALVFLFCSPPQNSNSDQERGLVRVMFYNVENLFDTFDDPEKNDEDFLPNGKMNWTFDRYQKKLNNISKVVAAVGQWELPELIGLCEIENRKVLEDLVQNTALTKADYGIIHKESPDERGIDVAALYRKDLVKPLSYQAIPVIFDDAGDKTREILYFKSLVRKTDTIHFFVNHWPSRWGGQEKSEPKRMAAAKSLKHVTDSILKVNPQAKLIITGDFNDDPIDKSLKEVLQANDPVSVESGKLYNLSLQHYSPSEKGSLKYKGNWNVFDQFIVSSGLLENSEGFHTSLSDSHIFYGTEGNEFLLEEDTRYQGKEPNRTYHGPTFHGGYSDHMPVYLDLRK
ncbi:MAG: hypothetical protein K9H64_16600 [Bacteroidales bacterium]|nr:hypothetical protein [Bacteroidales bacterium]MCF8457611.1 hypothetical protein [Bacteroidales bacterium]